MANQNLAPENYSFLSGGGEMGELMRTRDWSHTAVGAPGTWPQSLRTTLSIILNSRFPMFLFWGSDHTCFYNDAYRPSLGKSGKHPECLGKKAVEVWPEIWADIYPLIQQVLSGGGATWAEDQLLPIYRNGRLEDVYWTFSYSPVMDENGDVAGVFVTCTETTEKVISYNRLEESLGELQFAIDSAEMGTWDYNPLTHKFTANRRLRNWLGLNEKDDIELGATLHVIAAKDRKRVEDAINVALNHTSGGAYDIEYSVINPLTQKEIIVNAKGKASFNEENIAYRFNGIMLDVTEEVTARSRLQESEKKFRNTVQQAPLGITILRGPEHIVEMANSTYLEIVDKKEENFIGRSLFDSLPEVKTAVAPILENVLTTGVPYYGVDFPVYLNRAGENVLTYFNFVYHPLKEDNGSVKDIIVVASDVTASVKARHTLSESEKQFRNMVMQSPIPMTIFRGRDYVIETANKALIDNIWRKKQEEVMGRPVLEVFPELRDQKYVELLGKVYNEGIVHREKESVAWVQGDDGLRRFYLDFEYRPLLEADGSVSGVIITVNDVTGKVEARMKAEESEKRLNIVLDASELGTWEWNIQTDEMKYSERFLSIFGYKDKAIVTHDQLMNRLHPDDVHLRNEAFKVAYKIGTLNYESRIIWSNGIQRWIQVKGKVFKNNHGEPIFLIGTARDTTDEKYYQQELEDRERRFRLMADAMPHLVWTANAHGNFNYFNESFYNFSGLPVEELVKSGWLQLVHPNDREESLAAWKHAVDSGEAFIIEHRFLNADGQYRWQLSRAIPQKDELDNIRMWVGTSTDIQEIKELDEQKDLFIGMASHELKTPITTVKGYVQLLQEMYEGFEDDFLKHSLGRMHRQILTLTELISDLLDLSKIKSGNLYFNKEDFPVGELAAEIISNTKDTNPGHIIELRKGDNVMVHADRNRLAQVLVNFLTNAIKYAPDSKLIKVIIESDEDNVTVSVEDQGIGISKNDQEKIFQRFYRVEGKNEKTFPGFGIGLFISAEIIKKHAGSIGVTSEQGSGSTFYFTIPRIKT